MSPDLIVTNARVLTMDDANPGPKAVGVCGGRSAVGPRQDRGPCGACDRGHRCAGRTLLPGFFESHSMVLGGAELAHLQLTGIYGADPLGAPFAAYAAANPDKPLLMARLRIMGKLAGGQSRGRIWMRSSPTGPSR